MIEFTRRFGDRIQIIGDDYLVTSPQLTADAVRDGAANAVLIKVNQIGTVTEAVRCSSWPVTPVRTVVHQVGKPRTSSATLPSVLAADS